MKTIIVSLCMGYYPPRIKKIFLIINISFLISFHLFCQVTTDILKKDTIIREAPVFNLVEKIPQFPGGESARLKYLEENVQYPEYALKNGIQGRVFVTFVVEKDGSITDVKLLRGIGGGCDEEALRVISSMPKWKPGMQDGQPVRVQFNIPINFYINAKSKGHHFTDLSFNKGLKFLKQGSYEMAIEYFNKSISIGSSHKESYYNRGICYYYLGQYEQALHDIRKAQNLKANILGKTFASAYYNIANEYLNMGNYAESIELFNESLLLNKDDPEVYYNGGVAYFQTGEKEKGCSDWQAARDLGLKGANELLEQKCK